MKEHNQYFEEGKNVLVEQVEVAFRDMKCVG